MMVLMTKLSKLSILSTLSGSRNNLLLTRNNLLHTSRSTSSYCQPSSKERSKRSSRRPSRGQPNICSARSKTSNFSSERACTMTAPSCLPTTRNVPLIQLSCTFPMV